MFGSVRDFSSSPGWTMGGWRLHSDTSAILLGLPIRVRIGADMERRDLRVELHLHDAATATDLSVRLRIRTDLERLRLEL